MKNGLYEDKDFVQVVDAAGNPQEHLVPKAWVGTELLPQGWKAAGRSSRSSTPPQQQVQVPAETASREVLEAFAVNSAGFTVEQVKAFGSKPDLHAAIVKATSSGS